MAKKRQEFPKTQLKPGRTLTKRKHVAPSVKAKKLILPKRNNGSPKSIQNILEALNSQKAGSATHRVTSLQQLEDLIDSDQVAVSIAEIFETVSKFILDLDDNIRNAAVKVFKKIFEKQNSETLKTKILSLSPLLVTVLECGMASTSIKVKGSTLVLLGIILENYPDLICNSSGILTSFNHLIFVQIRKSCQLSSKSSSMTPMLHDGQINNENYKIQVFDTMKLFLKKMLKKFEKDVEEHSVEQEIYWNCEEPLHLEIYAGGGLKPVDIEKSTVEYVNPQVLNFEDTSIMYDFIIPIIAVIRQTFHEEIPSHIKSHDNLQNKTIQNMNVLLQVLCQIAELIQLVPCDEVDQEIRSFLLDDIFKHNLFPFHSSGVFGSIQRAEAAELNLAVCFLHSRFILHTQYCKDQYNRDVIKSIKNVFDLPPDIRRNSVPMIVKILKAYYSLTHLKQISEFIIEMLGRMSQLLLTGAFLRSHVKQLSENSKSKDVLISLFTKLSLYPAYDFLIGSEAMRNWFSWLLDQLIEIPSSCIVNKNLLRVTKIIANRKYSSFFNALSRMNNSVFKDLLEYDDPDVRNTAIFLIYNLKNISESLLADISKVILLDASFPTQYAIRFIRLLTSRFTEKYHTSDEKFDESAFREGRTNFIQFLLNVAIDSLNLNVDKWFDYEANKYVKALEPFKNVAPYNIFPSLHWKKHSKLFDVCQQSLSLLPQKLVSRIALLMFKEVLDDVKNLPIHSTIAILKLSTWEINDRYYHFQLNDLIFSCLFTTSVLTQIITDDEWYMYNIVQLMDNMKLNRRIAVEALLRQLESEAEISDLAFYHIMRICKYFLDKGLFQPDDGEKVMNILEGFTEKCPEKNVKQQPLFLQLYNVFYYYA